MRITWDPNKRAKTLAERGLDFDDATLVFAGKHTREPDTRKDYGERRIISAGYLRDRMVVIVWTQRDDARHVISMRHCHEDEEAEWREQLG